MPEKTELYGLCVYYVVQICDFGMLRVNEIKLFLGILLVGHPGTLWLLACGTMGALK